MKIISEPSSKNPFLVLYKEAGLPSAPLVEGEDSAFTQAANLFPEVLNVEGKKSVEHGLIHRIDTKTRGLILIATTQPSYDCLVDAQKRNLFEKWYKAEVDKSESQILAGFPPFEAKKEGDVLNVSSYFRSFGPKGREVRPVTSSSNLAATKKSGDKVYSTQIKFIDDEKAAVCRITNGFRHQVRCHLSWSLHPVKGDLLYNPNATDDDLCFEAFRIKFPHPLTGEMLCFGNM